VDLVRAANQFRPDIVWIDKGLIVNPGTLKELKKIKAFLVIIHLMINSTQATNLVITLPDSHCMIST
jgi:hypothetical protein